MKDKTAGRTRQFAIVLIVVLMSSAILIGCNRSVPGITTTSTVTHQFANTSNIVNDVTAVTTVNPGSGNAEGCVAGGGAQPPVPSVYGWWKTGTSPAVGKCFFSDMPRNTVLPFDFFSGACLGAHQPYDILKWLQSDSSGVVPAVSVCTLTTALLPAADSHFAVRGQEPATITVGAYGLSSTNGFPQLLVYDSQGNLAATTTANAVATDGSSATFPFPLATNGSHLFGGFYMLAVKNMIDANGDFKIVDATYYAIGDTAVSPGAFGIDAADVTVNTTICTGIGIHRCDEIYQITSSTTTAEPLIAQYFQNQLTFRGSTIPVGSQPVAVKAFATSHFLSHPDPSTTVMTFMPTRAIVVNSGSNNVSVVNLASPGTLATISVGTQPMGLALSATKAYVANFGSGTVSEIDLASFVVSRTVTVGAGAQVVTLDPAGTAIWVGGSGYLKKVDLATFTVTATQAVNGAITSLETSSAQNELVFTLVSGTCCDNGSGYSAQELPMSTLTPVGNYGASPAQQYASYTMNATLPTPAAIPGATRVSTQWGNGMVASATPTGFVIYDLVNHVEIMRGSTPTPVRGIASDPSNTVIFFTLPDSNEYLSVPFPK